MKNIVKISSVIFIGMLVFVACSNMQEKGTVKGCCGQDCCDMDNCKAMVDQKSSCDRACCHTDGCKKESNGCCTKG